MEIFAIILYSLLVLIVLIVFASIKIVNEYERGVKFTLGRYVGVMQPGLRFVVPLIQSHSIIDIRQTTIDLKPQEVMTKDQVNLRIDGVVFYTVTEPEKSLLNVENLEKQLEDKATSELKEIIGNKTMKESLSDREDIAETLMKMLNEAIRDNSADPKKRKDWGIEIKAIQINNIELPKELIRAMAKQAEAEREKEARITKASGESDASKKFVEASQRYQGNPEAMRLRELQTFQEIGTEHNSLMIVIPSTMASVEGNWVLPLGKNFLDKQIKKQKK